MCHLEVALLMQSNASCAEVQCDAQCAGCESETKALAIPAARCTMHTRDLKAKTVGSPARSGRPVALLCAVILVVSSRTLGNTQREFWWTSYMRIMGT